MIDLTPMVQAVLSLAATVITVMVIPFIKSKLNANKLDELQKWAAIAVKAADQMFWGENSGTDKKNYVTDFLKSKGYTINAAALETLIESEVQQLVRRPASAPAPQSPQVPQAAAELPQSPAEIPLSPPLAAPVPADGPKTRPESD